MALYNSTKSPPPRQSVSLYWLGGGLSNAHNQFAELEKHIILLGVLKGGTPFREIRSSDMRGAGF